MNINKIRSFGEWLSDKENPMVYCLLSLDGEPFLSRNSYEVILEQKTNAHDTFSIIVPDDALDTYEGFVMENSKKLLGKKISLSYWQYGSENQVFSGIVTGLKNRKESGYGKLIITGHSPSILLENGRADHSFEQLSLSQIVKEIGVNYPQEGKIHAEEQELNVRRVLPYTVQSQESDFGFIQRLATRYGEYFYYNGKELIFGNKAEPVLELSEGRELIELEFELGLRAQGFSGLVYDAEKGESIQHNAQEVQTEWKENALQAVAVQASKQLFGNAPKSVFSGSEKSQELEEMLLKEKENRESLIWVRGRSRDSRLKNGSRAKLTDINGRAMETYRIVEIRHYYNGDEYYNEFVGVSDVLHPPYQDSGAFPKSHEQMGRVVENADPLGLGRVRVQMMWQKAGSEKTPWIRLLQPHSGSGKGFYFVPEIGEEVLVGFQGGNAEKPYVIGTQYNGKEKSGYADKENSIKAVHTRSGHKLVFTEDESILITDKSGNEILLDTKGSNITITAPETMTLNAKNLNINVSQNMTTNVGMNAYENISMNKTTSIGLVNLLNVGADFMTNVVGKLSYFIKGDMETYGEKDRKITSLKGIETISEGQQEYHSEKEMRNNSGEKSKLF
ncbi:MAG: type VI secretion system Vgr family protein [Flavobacteriaceae bacterium]|jgi:phage-related baseplate assembly protein